MRYLGGHLGSVASALVDGQLDQPTADRAWAHVHTCPSCRRAVEHEGWVKTRLSRIDGTPAADAAPDGLVGSLVGLPHSWRHRDEAEADHAWATVDALEQRGRGRRMAGIALVGAGSVSVAVLGFASLGGANLGIGGATTPAPSASLTRPAAPATVDAAPVAHVQGRLPALREGRGLRR